MASLYYIIVCSQVDNSVVEARSSDLEIPGLYQLQHSLCAISPTLSKRIIQLLCLWDVAV